MNAPRPSSPDPFASIDALNHLEETFYSSGFQEGYAHGALHGTFEGRALGKEKAFELWEEVGFYEGMGLFWKDLLEAQAVEGAKESRPLQNLHQLLSLVSLFPTINLSSPDAPASPSSQTNSSSSEPDLSALLERIRARYKLTCSSLGIRPRLTAAKMTDADEEAGEGEVMSKGKKVVVNGVGPSLPIPTPPYSLYQNHPFFFFSSTATSSVSTTLPSSPVIHPYHSLPFPTAPFALPYTPTAYSNPSLPRR
ncbi:hypothetical protein BDY24DRAFT_439800 [Mrakia frigida]|uniref:Yae1 family protein n=1 Tax=Mrakia frigida TaxID=29902 RepID=UPI003FCC1F2C